MSHKTYSEFKLAPVAAALVLAFGGAYAQQTPEVMALITPESTLSVGVGGVSSLNESKRLGQYTGLNNNASALVDFEKITRDDVSGTWTTLTGRNLGLDTRELGFSRQKQGDWKYALDYNEIVRNDPNVIHTGMTGIGSATPTVNLIQLPAMSAAWQTANNYIDSAPGVVGSDVQLKLKRTALGLGGDKWISPELQLELNFRNEDKKGARMFGRVGISSGDVLAANVSTQGTGNLRGNGALLLTPEPIDSITRSIDAKLNFNRGNLGLTGGYYGSFFTNNFGNLSPSLSSNILNRGALWNGGTTTVAQLTTAGVALPPDNQAHQLYVSGTYAYSQTTRTNFKLSYTHATQDENFAAMGLQSAGPTSLGGVVDTTLAQVGLTMRPIKNLSINASLRYEDRNDKTPISVYNIGKVNTALDQTTNWPSGSQQRTSAKAEGIYRLPDGYSVNMGVDWERKKNPLPIANTGIYGTGGILFRETLDETGLRAGIRKAMSETLNGALNLEYKVRRSGDSWVTGNNLTGNAIVTVNPAGNYVLPDMYMDRDRTKLRANLDWDPSEKLSLQAVVEHGQDDYKRDWTPVVTQVIPIMPGARTITNDSLTLDASYKVSDDWRLNGYWTHSENRWNVNKSALGDDTKNKVDTIGFSVKGKVSPRFSIGMDVLVADDVTTFNNFVAPTVAGIAAPGTLTNADIAGNIGGANNLRVPGGNYLPNINYNTKKLNLFGIYEVDKKSAVKVNVIYQEFKNDDWQWGYNGVPFVYSDNTTVSNPNQSVTFLGVSYLLKF